MSTSTFSSAPTNANVDAFKAWASGLSAALTAVGFAKTADTGQIDISGVQAVPGINTYAGYEIRAFSDSLQSSNPVYVKIEYGTGTGASYPGVRIQVGRGSDGAGNLTGATLSSQITFQCGTVSSSSYTSYVSGASDRIAVSMWPHASNAYNMGFFIERTKNDSGANTDEGVNIAKWQGGSSSGDRQAQFLPKVGAANPASPMSGMVCCVPNGETTGAYGGNIGLYPTMPHMGYAGNPDLGALLYFTGDIGSAGSVITATIYGQSHSFITGGKATTATLNGATGVGVAIRYE